MTLVYLIIIIYLIVTLYVASDKIKQQKKRIDILERGVDALEKIEISNSSMDIKPNEIIKGASSGITAKVIKCGSKGTLSIK